MNNINNTNITPNTAMIAMSGGVDSSVSAQIMIDRGFSCVGATMKLFEDEGACCSADDIKDAKAVADTLGIEHFSYDFSGNFTEKVIDKFVYCYENGLTPNPCIECNRHLKFNSLYDKAKEHDCHYIVTGHYSQIEYNNETERFVLKKAADLSKDQSYVLYSLNQYQLAHTIFPLGGLTKDQVREIAQKHNFINANKKESQDICFVKGCTYTDFIRRYTNKDYPEGNFVDTSGKILGRHKGIIHYTIGQRKGLGLSLARPMFVVKVDLENNNVVLGTQEDLLSKTLTATDINLISVPDIKTEMRVKAKIRYRQAEQWATVKQTCEDTLFVEFDEPQRAITKGQSVVLYDNDIVVGGGTIC